MKKITLLLLLAAAVLTMSAQEENDKAAWKSQLPRHDFQIGISDPGLSGFATGSYYIHLGGEPYDYYTPNTWFDTPDAYQTPTRTSGTLHISYVYRVAKWCALGGTVSYAGFFNKTRDRITDEVIGRHSQHYITVMPTVRFSWFNRPCVTMYSGLALGLGIVNQRGFSGYPGTYSMNYSSITTLTFAGQLTLFGVQAGRKWYGFAEIGVGYRSILTAGFGYHFNRIRD